MYILLKPANAYDTRFVDLQLFVPTYLWKISLEGFEWHCITDEGDICLTEEGLLALGATMRTVKTR